MSGCDVVEGFEVIVVGGLRLFYVMLSSSVMYVLRWIVRLDRPPKMYKSSYKNREN